VQPRPAADPECLVAVSESMATRATADTAIDGETPHPLVSENFRIMPRSVV
jgi:hypothetical protein